MERGGALPWNNSFKLNSLLHGKSTKTYDTEAHRRGIPEQRLCDWQMHQLHWCLIAQAKTDNPHYLFPHPYLPGSFKLKLSGRNYFCEECVDLRLLSEQYCDDIEQVKFIMEELKIWKQKKKTQYGNVIKQNFRNAKDTIMSIIPLTIPTIPTTASTVESPSSSVPSVSLRNPRIAEIEKTNLSELKKKYTLDSVNDNAPKE